MSVPRVWAMHCPTLYNSLSKALDPKRTIQASPISWDGVSGTSTTGPAALRLLLALWPRTTPAGKGGSAHCLLRSSAFGSESDAWPPLRNCCRLTVIWIGLASALASAPATPLVHQNCWRLNIWLWTWGHSIIRIWKFKPCCLIRSGCLIRPCCFIRPCLSWSRCISQNQSACKTGSVLSNANTVAEGGGSNNSNITRGKSFPPEPMHAKAKRRSKEILLRFWPSRIGG